MDIIKFLKDKIENFELLIEIEEIDSEHSNIKYIEKTISKYGCNFHYKCKIINSKQFIRNNRIENIFNVLNDYTGYDVESIIYTKEELDRINQLRSKSKKSDVYKILNELKEKYSNSFKVGDSVFYKNQYGIITFKHLNKSDDIISKWSVKVKDKEYRYVSGLNLLQRKKEDLSNIPLNNDLNKLSTYKLLSIFKNKRKRNKGVGDKEIKKILNNREHIQKSETKIIVCDK